MNVVIENQLKSFCKMCHIENMSIDKQFEYFINYIVIKQYISLDVNNLDKISTGKNAPGIDGIGIIIDGKLMLNVNDVKKKISRKNKKES